MSDTIPAMARVATLSPLQQQFGEVRTFTEGLVAQLAPEDLMVQSMPDASPAKWHMAHTTWFFETFLLCEYEPDYKPFDPEFRQVFNSYYKGIGKHPVRGTRGTFSRPTLDRVLAYRAHVNAAMDRLIANGIPEAAQELIVLGLNHEQQHQELMVTDLKHGFWSQPLRPSFTSRERHSSSGSPREMQWTHFEGGIIEIGSSNETFSFDNEQPRHSVLLRPYRLANRLVSNREYLAFMEDRGYVRPELWLSEGWDLIQAQGWDSPLYWEDDGGWQVFTASGMKELALDEPVCHVSYFEADAYARWSGARLPLEAEWEHAAGTVPLEGNFAESRAFHPSSQAGTTLSQMFGDCWEWTGSAYLGYPGFRPAAGAVGEYNGKFMCNQFVLRGGSCATPQTHIRASYRNFFPPSARWQFMGIRLAADAR